MPTDREVLDRLKAREKPAPCPWPSRGQASEPMPAGTLLPPTSSAPTPPFSPVAALDPHILAELKALDTAHHLHPFTDTQRMAEAGGTRIITRGEGVWIYDDQGRKILDAMAGLWAVHVGYGREELIDAATRQMRELSFYNSFFRTTTAPAAKLAARLIALAPQGQRRVFFSNSGSEAVETALRIIRQYWDLKEEPQRQIIIGRTMAYHGSTRASASVGGMQPMHVQGGLTLDGFTHLPHPDFFSKGGDHSPADFGRAVANMLEYALQQLGPHNVAAFFAEPVQGAGGVIIPPTTYFPEIQRICRKYGVLLVADEVVTAFGRIGHWFGSEAFGLTPDLITVAKGLTSGYFPLAATLIHETVDEVLIERGGDFNHGFTTTAHPVGCAVALANLDLMERESLIERARHDIGPYLLSALKKALAEHPIVGEVRGLGMIFAIELAAGAGSRKRLPPEKGAGSICRDYAWAAGVVIRAVGDTMVFAPPLTLTHTEADELVARARLALDATSTAVL